MNEEPDTHTDDETDEEGLRGLLGEEPPPRPIIIRRKSRENIKSHGGAWKVAYADFATAMMAFFLLMWIIGSTTEEQKDAIAHYFEQPGAAPIGAGGANASIIELKNPLLSRKEAEVIDPTQQPEKPIDDDDLQLMAERLELQRLASLQLELEERVNSDKAFERFKEQIHIGVVPDGLRIEVFDKKHRPMFDSGGHEPKFYTRALFFALAKLINQVPNRVSITGHTDALPFVDKENYSNWELSSERANAARRALERGGLDPEKIAKVEGFGASALYDKANPTNPINRRIAIIVLKKSAMDSIDQNISHEWDMR
ncbi:MAG: flagellar motor protein MotB [Pseudomonadota bacterium]